MQIYKCFDKIYRSTRIKLYTTVITRSLYLNFLPYGLFPMEKTTPQPNSITKD